MTPLQKKELNIFLEFERICKKLSLKYYLVCGSALGAEKYEGFIPWDDDMDVAMPRDDYDNFVKEAQKYLPENIFVQNSFTEPNFPAMYTKLRDSHSTFVEKSVAHIKMNHGVFIDVFPLDGYPKYKLSQFIFEIKKRYYNTIFLSVADVKRTTKTTLVHKVLSFFKLNKNMAKVSEKYNNLVSKYSLDSSDFWCNHGNSAGKLDYSPKAQFGKGRKSVFEGIEVIVPEKSDEYLTQKYGNWRADLPKEERQGHHVYAICDVDTPFSEYIAIENGGKVCFEGTHEN